ncbi:MAG: response regulator [Bacteroidia bacterium]
MNVLIIEDERSLSHEIEIYLTKQGFHCDVAFTGSKASEMVAVNSYDFVLLDIGLPDTNGFEILRKLKTIMWTVHLLFSLHAAKQTIKFTDSI